MPNLFGILGLSPFVWLATYHKSMIAHLVAFNGLLFHTFFRTNQTFKYYDIMCNVLLTLYVNASARDPWILFFTIIAIVGFANNIHSPEHKPQELAKDIAHVLNVQLPLFIGLYVFLIN